ncbi:uncharacterized protein ARMOST_06182 [Armillaria ostoyae]|uniref:Heterokaryon incompatibility domain-containing protein n=1 Tax=Armillaria ostoyae TaxID=47428 RepID=A0A284R276_ARMOS|nr:uncharacterized protein ARMOST_06182 [Armillaria ostoyae]
MSPTDTSMYYGKITALEFKASLYKWIPSKWRERAIPRLEGNIARLKRDRVFSSLPEVTISSDTEIGKPESSIKVPLQRVYTGSKPVISSSLANTPCTTLGIQCLLDLLNTILGTSYTLRILSLYRLLEECIRMNYDFGATYARLRPIWFENWRAVEEKLRTREAEDLQERQEAIVNDRIVGLYIMPRRVWDLYSNRVVPWWVTHEWPRPISHAWVAERDRIDVWTPINGYQWPIPIPRDANLDLIRIEMLNLGAEYVWLDVLCLRQKGGRRDDLRAEEWRLDVPTIGAVYRFSGAVVWYLSGLGRPLSVKVGDLDSDQCWFRRAWTLQEIGRNPIVAGDIPDGPLHTERINEDENGILTRFHKQLMSVSRHRLGMFDVLSQMQKRVSTNAVDKVAGLAFSLGSQMIPAYYESQSLEDAWIALVNAMGAWYRAQLFFLYPKPGNSGKKWRPSWKQVMTEPMPRDYYCSAMLYWDEEADEDWCDGCCIEKGIVHGLDVGGVEGVDRSGQLIVENDDGTANTFTIIAPHQQPIPEDTYTLLGNNPPAYLHGTRGRFWVVGRRPFAGQMFQKVSVFVLASSGEVQRLKDLGVATRSRNMPI